MCTITKKLKKEKIATGYKLVLKFGRSYYSPATGLKYTVGMEIPIMKKVKTSKVDGNWPNPLHKYSVSYEERMQGYTGVFANLRDLKDSYLKLSPDFNYTIIKIKLGGIKYEGELKNKKTYIGNKILDIEEELVDFEGCIYLSL